MSFRKPNPSLIIPGYMNVFMYLSILVHSTLIKKDEDRRKNIGITYPF